MPSHRRRTDKFYIALNDGADTVSGTFASVTGLPSGWTVVYDANGDGGLVGNDIAIEAVPEPSTWCAAALAAAVIGFQLCQRVRSATRNSHRLTNVNNALANGAVAWTNRFFGRRSHAAAHSDTLGATLFLFENRSRPQARGRSRVLEFVLE